MLFEFHRQQNAKKPGTVHATYLLSGTKQEELQTPIPTITKDGEDEYMHSSPFVTSSMPEQESLSSVHTTTISLVREEDLDSICPFSSMQTNLTTNLDVKSRYETITSIQVYSLGPHPLKDLHLLSDTSREIQVLTASEDSLEHAATYGTIVNPLVKRRTNRRPPPISAPKAAVPVVQTKPAEPAKSTTKSSITTKQDGKASQSATAKDFFGKSKEKTKAAVGSGPSSKESTPAPPPTLKRESSSIFKSFAKTPKLKRDNTDSAAEDVSMKGLEDDDDDEEETYVPPVQVKKEKVNDVEETAGDRKSRKEREAALKQMMEESDEEEIIPTPEPDEEEIVLEKEKLSQEPEPTVTISGGRRRGKRRVMKKRTVKDDEGYLGKFYCLPWFFDILTNDSHKRRSCLGIFLRRRTSGASTQTKACCCWVNERQKGQCQTWTRQYHELFW